LATTKRAGGADKGAKGTRGGGAGHGGHGGGDRPRIRSSHDAGPGRPRPSRATHEPAAKRAAAPKLSIGPRTRKARAPSPTTPSTSIASDDARALAVLIAVAAIDKKAVGLEILDVAGKVDYADFLVLMTGRSDRQVGALAQGIEEALRKKGRRPISVEGTQEASWILMDYGDVVVHVFQDDARSLYDIEGLWLDVRRIPVPLPEGVRQDSSSDTLSDT
jgi:ribosome-associated protein